VARPKPASPLGGEGKSVQADETYYGNTSKRAKGYKKGHSHKQQIVALVEPKGKARAAHVKTATKRGMVGTYHKCDEQHLQRYVTEFEFRFNNRTTLGVNDKMRAETLLKGIEGKRLTYRRPN
jgi:transposase-like protein